MVEIPQNPTQPNQTKKYSDWSLAFLQNLKFKTQMKMSVKLIQS